MTFNKNDIDYCKKIMEQCGPTYYWATKLFPKEIRQATYILYAFYRVPDDIVDLNTENPEQELTQWVKDWQYLYQNPTEENILKANPVLRSSFQVHQKYNIPFKYSESFLKAMLQDLTKETYEDYQELEDYMYGSAAVVGIMMTYLMNPNPDTKTLKHAEDLGYAMQLTNFLRDISEDIDDRQRIYMPQNDLKKYKITSKDIQDHQYPDQWSEFMQSQIQKCYQLYESGYQGLQYLPKRAAWCIRLASKMYQDYLTKIEKSNYQVFHSNYKLKTNQKMFILLKHAITQGSNAK